MYAKCVNQHAKSLLYLMQLVENECHATRVDAAL